MSIYGCNMNLELQQRAVEYNLVIKKYENLRDGLFEQMPPLEMRPNINLPNGVDDDETAEQTHEASLIGDEVNGDQHIDMLAKQKEEATKNILDIFDDLEQPTATTMSHRYFKNPILNIY